MTEQQIAMKELQDSAESRIKKLTESSGLYPGDQTYDKMCEMVWKDHHKTMDRMSRQMDKVKSGTLDKKSPGRYTRADTMKHSTTPEKRPCKHLACVATPGKQSRFTSINSDSGSPIDYQSASKQNDSEQEYSYPSKSDRDSLQDDG